jgi:hypothetical protein
VVEKKLVYCMIHKRANAQQNNNSKDGLFIRMIKTPEMTKKQSKHKEEESRSTSGYFPTDHIK